MTLTRIIMINAAVLLAGIGLGWLAGRHVYIFGEGTWDGRSGGETHGNATLSFKQRADNKFYEYHITWIWRDRMIDCHPQLKKLCERAQKVFAGQDCGDPESPGAPSFWMELKNLKPRDEAWSLAVDGVKKHDISARGWVFRAFNDTDDRGRHYKAIEATARLFFAREDDPEKKVPEPEELMDRFLADRASLTKEEMQVLSKALERTLAETVGLKELMDLP